MNARIPYYYEQYTIRAAKIAKKSLKHDKIIEKSKIQCIFLLHLGIFAYLRGMFNVKSSFCHLLFCAVSVPLAIGLAGCASIGRPEGGLFDEDPPVLLQSEPAEGSVQVSKQRIQFKFNENVKLDKANEKLTVSPPQQKMPRILSNAKTVTIELTDSLKPNTTYSIDLGDAVQDNNEGNPLDGLTLLFSTGDHIDSLQICGHLVNAADLEPITGAYVGVYRIGEETEPGSIDADSLFRSQPFERAGKTDAFGAFRILGCAPGVYQLFSLIDGNTNYHYDMDSEDIAFLGAPIVLDNSTAPDSTLILYSFNEGRLNRYLDDVTRQDTNKFSIRFSAWMPEPPKLSLVLSEGIDIEGDSLFVPQFNATYDTLTYWIRDPRVMALDTLLLSLTYLHTDTLHNDVWQTDTLRLDRPEVKATVANESDADTKKKGRKQKKAEISLADSLADHTVFMTLKMVSGSTLDIGRKPQFVASAPIDSLHLEFIHLQMQKDTLWNDLPMRLEQDSLNPMLYTLFAEPHFTPGGSYRVQVDSAAMHSIYGHPVNATTFTFKEKTPDEYAHLLFNITGCDTPAFVQILDSKDKPLQTSPVINGQAKFVHLPAGTYYARLVADINGNGKFDAGNLDNLQQPEKVYYLPNELKLRANWSIDQAWDILATPILEQKPDEVKTNKPKVQTERKSKNEEYLRQHPRRKK